MSQPPLPHYHPLSARVTSPRTGCLGDLSLLCSVAPAPVSTLSVVICSACLSFLARTLFLFVFKPVKWNMRVQLKIIDGLKKLGLNLTYLHFLPIFYLVAFNYCVKLERTRQDYKVVSAYSNRTLKRNMKEERKSVIRRRARAVNFNFLQIKNYLSLILRSDVVHTF